MQRAQVEGAGEGGGEVCALSRYLSITVRHSLRQVKRLPLRSRKFPGVVTLAGADCFHSRSSVVEEAGLMFKVAPPKIKDSHLMIIMYDPKRKVMKTKETAVAGI